MGQKTPKRNSLEKMLDVLELFESDQLQWTSEQMMEVLGYTRSTLYRYLKVLSDAGFLTSLSGASYTLGPRIVQLDYKLRMSDPLIRHSRALMIQLVQDFPAYSTLFRYYRDSILCIHQESGTDEFNSHHVRGRSVPFTYGAVSRVIFAHLPRTRLQQILKTYHNEFKAAGYEQSFSDLLPLLRQVRQNGYDIDYTSPRICRIAVPIFDAHQSILGAISLTLPQKYLTEETRMRLIDRIVFCAQVINTALRAD